MNLSLPMVLALAYHREAQDAERQAAGSFWVDDREFGDLVFRQANGRRLDPRADFAAWVEIIASAGAKPGGTHLARHTNASLLLEAGVPTRVVAELLGHSRITMTARHQHGSAGMTEVASQRIEGVLWS